MSIPSLCIHSEDQTEACLSEYNRAEAEGKGYKQGDTNTGGIQNGKINAEAGV